MGACENTCEAHEASLHCATTAAAAIEQHSCWGIKDSEQLPCLETSCNPIDSNVDPTGEIDANDGSASLSNVVEDVLVGKGIGLEGQSENAVGTIAGQLLEDECGVSGACWNVRQSEVDDCNGEMGRFCDEEVRFGGLNEGWVNCESSLVELVTVSGPLATCGQQYGQTNDKNAGAQGLMEEKKDVLVAIETDCCDQLATSTFCEMSAELIPVNEMARNGDRQDDENNDESGSVEGVMEEKIDGLDGTGTFNCDETVLSPSCEMHAKLIQVNDLCRNCNQQDDQKDDKSGSVQGVMEGNCDGLASRLADNCNEIVRSSSCDMPAELILTNGFSSDGTELHNHDYKTSQQVVGEERNSDLTAVLEISHVHAVMEWKSDGFMEKEIMDTCEKTLPSPGDGMTSESIPANCLSRNGVEQDKQGGSTSMVVAMEENSNDLSGIENSRIEGIVQEKSNGLATIETDTCDDICPSLGCEIPAGLIPADGSPRNGVEQDEQDNCTSPMVVTEEKSVHLTVLVSDNHSQVLPSLGHQVLSGVTTVTCPSRKGVQQDDQMGDQLISCLSSKHVNSTFHKGAIEVEEKKHDLLARVETDIDNQIWNVEMHSESVPFSGLLNGCSQQSKLDTKVISSLTETVLGLESNMSASIGTDMCPQISPHGAIDSSSAVDCSGQTDNEGKDHVGIDCVSKARCHDIVSSSRRSTGEHKSSRKTQTKRAARKRRNTTKVQNLSGGVEAIFKTATKKRSCSSKLARSSVWGSLGNVTQTFKLINGLELDEIKNHGSENAKVGQGIGKRNVIRAAGRSRRSSRKDCASASRIRLKVKVGKEVCQTESNQKIMVPEEIYSTASVDLISDYGTESYEGTSFDISKLANGTEDKAVEECTQKDLHSSANKQEKGKACCDPSVKDANLASKDMEGAVISNKSSGDAAEDYLGVRSHTEVEALGVAIEKRYTDPGTSPDSEVINSVPEGQAGARCPEDFSDAILTSSKAFAADEVAGSRRRGNKKESLPHAGNYVLEDGSLPATSINKVKAAKKRRSKERKGDCFSSSEILTSTSAIGLGNSSRKSNGVNEGRSKDSARRQKVNGCRERGNDRKSVNKIKGKEKKSVRDHVVYKGEDDPSSVADDSGKTISGDDTTKEEVANLDMVSSDVMEQNLSPDNAWVRCDDCLKWRRIPVGLVESISQTHCQWTCKDNTDKAFADCSIPQEKSNAEINAELGISDADEDPYDVPSNYTELECIRTLVSKEHEFTRVTTNQFLHRGRKTQSIDEIMVCHCKLPPDGRLGCGDECLNRMLNIECVQGTCPCGDLCSNQQFQKRNYAKMLWDRCGKKGFGLRLEEDISRGQFLIEYVGEVLDVHAYEARQKEYASKGHKHFYFMTLDGSEVIDACAKGNLGRFINHSCDPNCRTEKWVVNGEICIGLFALRDIKKGEEVTFDYNYVRVVGAAAKKCYCGTPQCQGYIGGDPTNTEVIDHVDSDEEFPEPVMLEDGEAGGSLKNTISKTSFFGISNDKDKMDSPKTAVKSEDLTEIEDPMNQSTPSTCQSPIALRMNNLPGDFLSSSQPIEISPRAKDVTSKATSAVQQEISMEETKSKSQKLKTSPSSMLTKPSTDERKPKSATAENKRVFVKSRFIIKTSHHSSFIKKGKSTTSPINVNKVQLIPNKHQEPSMKPKKILESTSNGHFEAVQEKLNELLDSEGGISKRKDSPRGYLKLLLLTAASGASRNGEAIQSNRELSMILDALLKTRSRVVLMDVISKNGLRMLHNMMKQYRRDFKKIPILRKLLKVLEYLAVREILTLEHINGGPPCPGMESFRVSMLSLTEHDDKQVHQIARKFRDKWIPRQARKFSYMDRDDGRAEFQRGSKCNRVPASHNHWHDHVVRYTEASSCVMESNLATTSAGTTVNESTTAPCVGSGTRTRKRKSRWDQPADGNTALGLLQHNEQKMESGLLEQSESNSLPDISKEVLDHADKADGEYNYCPHCVRNYCQQDETNSVDDGRENTHEDVPPGFSPPVIPVPVSSRASSTATELPQQDVCHLNCPVDAVDGFPQSKFISRLPVSYGFPLPIVQQCGSSLTETVESWVVAPGMPFHPFPPLPPLPSFKKEAPSSCAVNSMEIDGIPDRGQQDCHDPATCLKENNPSTTGADQPDMDGPGTNDHQTFKRAKVSSYDLGRRYFRQQKWNRVPPPWVRNRNGWGCIGDNSRGGVCSTEGGNLTIEHRNSYC